MFINKGYIVISMLTKIPKVEFYDFTFKIMIICFIISIGLVFVLPETILDSPWFIIPWITILVTAILYTTVFTIGMIVNAFKTKRYLWMIALIFLGTIFPIIFYFSIMRKEFKKEK